MFEDSQVYRQEKVIDADAYKDGEGLEATTPFGDLFQKGKHYEEDVYEPELPYGEKTWMQRHPLFGDFGVKAPISVYFFSRPFLGRIVYA